ncbi:MAG TPA: hypothetical protein VFP93_03550, partial [Gammaproteobacteria bacterium]|nr:hypothetical protein [Gammaproteobacteria bacterium]
QYNDALFHARTILEENITDEKFADYAHKVYFLSDGEPTANHSALDNQEWPEQWDSWQEFIQNPQSTIPNSFAQGIDAFAVSIGNSSKIEQALEPIVLDPKYVFSAQIDLANLGEELLRTVPDYFEANLLHNDIDNNHPRLVNEISFKVEDATQYMLDHNLYGTGAFASVDNTTVIIPVPPVDSYVEFPTPLGATCLLNPHGEIFYLPPKVEEDTFEIFEYYAIDLTNNNVDSAKVYFHVLSNHEKLHYVTGNEPLTNRGLEDVIILEGKEGDHTFIIDLENAKPQTIVIEDLFQNNNVLHFTHTQSVRLEELFTDFTVHGTLGPLEFTLADGPTTLMLNNPGAYVGDNLLEALRFLEQHVQVDIL